MLDNIDSLQEVTVTFSLNAPAGPDTLKTADRENIGNMGYTDRKVDVTNNCHPLGA